MDNGVVLVVLGITISILLIVAVVLLIRILISGGNDKNLENQLRHEIDKSRQETIATVQGSIKNMANIIAQGQRNSADLQSKRLSEMNRQLNMSLEQVNKGLGEMQSLAIGVNDLQKLLSNVKTRGIIGEVQLGNILEQILAPDQYDENVAVTGTSERVEFAVKFPGNEGEYIYLPIDSKFPGDAYMNLKNAYEEGDKLSIKAAKDNLKNAIIKAAKDIRNKYILPPYTTEFAIMFLPFEGLYAEVLRLGMVEKLQGDYRVTIAGPTTMAAMLNSFQMGFRSLALQKQSGHVWNTLSKVRTEFDKFQDVLDKSQKRLNSVQQDLENLVGTRSRAIRKTLKDIDNYSDELKDNKDEANFAHGFFADDEE